MAKLLEIEMYPDLWEKLDLADSYDCFSEYMLYERTGEVIQGGQWTVYMFEQDWDRYSEYEMYDLAEVRVFENNGPSLNYET